MHCLQMGNNINKTDWIRARPGQNRKALMGMKFMMRNSGDCFFKTFCVGPMGLNNSDPKIHIWNFYWTPTYAFKNDFFFSLIAHNRHINGHWNSSNFLKSSINVILGRQFEEVLLKFLCLSWSSNKDIICNVSIEEVVYLRAKRVRREIVSDSASVLNPLKHNFPISEHGPGMFSFYLFTYFTQ